jgi:hypothetical protein
MLLCDPSAGLTQFAEILCEGLQSHVMRTLTCAPLKAHIFTHSVPSSRGFIHSLGQYCNSHQQGLLPKPTTRQSKPRRSNNMADHTTTIPGQATPDYTQYLDDALPSLVELFEPAPSSMCEFGDIMLVIEDGTHKQLKLQVNSCILASTSKVFRALFRGCFAEGEAIRSGTREVYMNDDPTPMLALCQLLHLKTVEPAVKVSGLIDFALLVDKFDCVEALKHATDGILGQFDSEAYCDTLNHDLIASAHILDQPTHFRRFTKTLVRCSASHYRPDLDPRLQDLTIEHLPASFMSKSQVTQLSPTFDS